MTARLEGVDGVLFDIDDTLVDTRGAFAAAWREVVGTYLPQLGPAELPALLERWRDDPGGYYRSFVAGEIGYVEQRHARVNELHGFFGVPPLDAQQFAVWDEAYEAGFARAWAAFDDAVGALAAILAVGMPVGALTNAHRDYQVSKLTRTGLGHLEVLVAVDTLGFGKPDARVFVEAARRLGTPPERTVYVGDELDVDALAARAAGLQSVWLDRPGTRRTRVLEADVAAALADGVVRVTSLAELVDALTDGQPEAQSSPPS